MKRTVGNKGTDLFTGKTTTLVGVEFYPNGYGVSIITGGYGDANSPYELAVLIGDEEHSTICYDTPITDDVIGWRNETEIKALKKAVAALPAK